MENNNQYETEGANTSEPVGTGSHMFGSWLTVQEAVAYCMSKGLPRTPKTVRKWAQRSIEAAPGTGDVAVQRQDTENGFRWLIGRESLDVKIEQEKEFVVRAEEETEGANTSEPVPTGAHVFEQVATGAHLFEQVRLNEQATAPVRTTHENTSEPARTYENTSEPVLTGVHQEAPELVDFLKKQLERAERQLDVKDKQIDALLERDRETNVLIQGLQTSLTGVVNALPSGRREERHDAHRYAPPHEQGTQIRDA
jgi:hypothetical protein